MKQAAIVALLFVATLGISLWALGVFDGPSRPDLDATAPPRTTGPGTQPGSLPATEPKDEPRAEMPLLEDPVRVLAIAQAPRSFTRWLYNLWDAVANVSYQEWAVAQGEGTPPTAQKDLPPLTALPTAKDLAQVHVLILDDVDPKAFPADFWAAVAERVKAGTMGLLVVPGVVYGVELAQEPSLATVMPAKPAPVTPPARGSREIAGVFQEERPFAVTEDGRLHPASRLTSWPSWSGRVWEALVSGPWKWGTKFCHPVAEVAPGAKVLLNVRLGGDREVPALVASDPAAGRVLWVGFHDVGDAAIRGKGDAQTTRDRSFHAIRGMSVSWIAWLAKRL